MQRLPGWGRALLIAALGIGVYLRVEGLGRQPLFGDEQHALGTISSGWGAIWSSFDLYGSHTFFPLLQRACVELLGTNVWSLRLPAVAAGVLGLASCFVVGRRLVGPLPALLATAALAVSPIHVYYSRFGRSYTLTLLIALWLVHWLDAAAHRPERRRAWAGVALMSGLLVFSHLSALGVVAALGPCCLVYLLWGRRSPRAWAAPTAAFGAGGLLALALYTPALEALGAYREAMATRDNPPIPFDWVGIADLLAGGRGPGLALLALVPLAGLGLALERPRTALWLAAALLGPLGVLVATRPNGMTYAYSRYLLSALPLMAMAVAWLVARPVRRLAGARRGDALAAGLTVAVLGAGYWTGPLVPRRSDAIAFENTYLKLHALPAFDRPWVDTPAFYDELARDPDVRCIVETPPLRSRTVLLYRNYLLQHGKQVLIGLLDNPESDPLPVEEPYVPVDAEALAERGVDCLILHRAPVREVERYWSFVFDVVWPDFRRRTDRDFMLRQRYYLQPERTGREAEERLRADLGEPHYRDNYITVWRF